LQHPHHRSAFDEHLRVAEAHGVQRVQFVSRLKPREERVWTCQLTLRGNVIAAGRGESPDAALERALKFVPRSAT
jgi:hypothetical protein